MGNTNTAAWVNIDTLAKGAANIGFQESFVGDAGKRFLLETESCMMTIILVGRYNVAKNLAGRIPEFEETNVVFQKHPLGNLQRSDLEDEFQSLAMYYQDPVYSSDPRYLCLISAVGWALYYKTLDENTRTFMQSILVKMLGGSEVRGFYELNLLVAALWLSDYPGFRDKVRLQYADVLAERQKEQQAAEEEKKREQERQVRARRREQGVCQFCGGRFKGMFTRKCVSCGREKDY